MTLSSEEIDSLRFHLGYGNIAVGGEPYTPDTFLEVIEGVVSPNLGTGTETSSVTAVTAGSTAVMTLVSATGFVAYGQAVVDVGDQAEIVTIKVVSGADITASFAKAHAATGYPVATMSGKARLRMLLHDADLAYRALTDQSVGKTAGLKSVDKEDVVWFSGKAVVQGRLNHYKSIVEQISSLVRVNYLWHFNQRQGGCGRLEAY